MTGITTLDLSELLTTMGACWGLLLVAGAGIAALPWTDAEVVASGRALRRAFTAPLQWLTGQREPSMVHASLVDDLCADDRRGEMLEPMASVRSVAA